MKKAIDLFIASLRLELFPLGGPLAYLIFLQGVFIVVSPYGYSTYRGN